jgi:PAS domain S-box-containing protein
MAPRLPERRDLVAAGALVAALFAVGLAFDAFDRAEALLHRWAHHDLADEVVGLLGLLFVILAVPAIRRWRAGAREGSLRRETEQRYRTLVEQVPAVTYTWDASRPAGEVPAPFISPQIEELLGYALEEWLSDPELWIRVLHPDDRERVLAESNAADRDGGPFVSEYRALHRDGHVVWIRDEARVVARDRDGRPVLSQGVMQDITERKLAQERLASAEERHRLLIEHLPVAVYTDAADEEVTALYVSPQYERITGYSPEERTADPGLWRRMLHPDDRERVIAESDRVNETGEDFDMEYRIVTADGRTAWLHDHGALVAGSDGERVWQGVLTDITERRAAEDAIARAERILAATAFAAQQLLRAPAWEAVIDDVLERIGEAAQATRSFVCRNEADDADEVFSIRFHAWERTGFELPGGSSPHDRFPWRTGGFGRWAQRLADGTPVVGLTADMPSEEREVLEAEPYLVRSALAVPITVDGTWWGYMGLDQCEEDRVWHEAEIEAVMAAANMLGAAIERERSAERLAEAERRYQAIVEHIPAAIYVDAPDGSLDTLYISPQIEEITGITPQEWRSGGDAWLTAVDPADVEEVRRTYLEAIEREEPWVGEYRMRTRDGRTIWVHDETTIVRDESGAARSIQGVLYDITERKLAEHALRESELRERQAVERLRALDEMKNTFLAAVSHELRSPLTSILGLSLTLERSPALSEPDRNDLLGRLVANARKLDRLLKDLLDLDRLGRGIVEPQHRLTDVAELAGSTLDSLDGLADRVVLRELHPSVAAVDGPKVERIVENLLANAAKHTTDDRRIWLRVEPTDGGVLIAVEDDGPGVPEELRDAIFEPFRQGPTARPHAPGTGVGLSLVARFAELHGGRAWVEPRRGGGASFRVFLPTQPRVGDPADDAEVASSQV